MSVEHVEVLVEEPSMAEALRILLPKVVGGLSFEIHPHQSKHDLLARLPGKLRGYARWIPATFRIVVVVDRDDDDCHERKARLEKLAAGAQLATRSTAKPTYVVVNRLAIEELEAWYFGDWKAVRTAYPKAEATVPAKAKYRAPDNIQGGTWEAFEHVLQEAGYFAGGLRKIEAARTVAEHMVPLRNTSPSFRALCAVLAEMAAA